MDSGDGDWRTPKVSHVRPTVRSHLKHQAWPSSSVVVVHEGSSPGIPVEQSTPFPPLEEGPLGPITPSPNVATLEAEGQQQSSERIEGRVIRIEKDVQAIASMYIICI